MHADGRGLDELLGLYRAGRLRIVVERTFPPAEAAQAHRLLERGRVVLRGPGRDADPTEGQADVER